MDDVTKNNDNFLLSVRSYIDSVADHKNVCEGVNLQGQAKGSSHLTTSTISSQRKHNFLMAVPKRKEAEQQEKAVMHPAKQKHLEKELETKMEKDGTSRIGGRPSPACCRSQIR